MKTLSEESGDEYQHTEEEVRDILITVLTLGFAFTVALFGGTERIGFVFQLGFLKFFLAATILVGFSIIAKEMAQKATARALESHVQFELWAPGVVISILSSFLGVVFAVVNGTRISTEYAERYGRWRIELNPRHMGIIASIGPLMNISIAMAFLMLEPVVPGLGLGENIMIVGAKINAYMALFSMTPINPLDGAKVLRWSITLWIFNILMSLAVIGLAFGWI